MMQGCGMVLGVGLWSHLGSVLRGVIWTVLEWPGTWRGHTVREAIECLEWYAHF